MNCSSVSAAHAELSVGTFKGKAVVRDPPSFEKRRADDVPRATSVASPISSCVVFETKGKPSLLNVMERKYPWSREQSTLCSPETSSLSKERTRFGAWPIAMRSLPLTSVQYRMGTPSVLLRQQTQPGETSCRGLLGAWCVLKHICCTQRLIPLRDPSGNLYDRTR